MCCDRELSRTHSRLKEIGACDRDIHRQNYWTIQRAGFVRHASAPARLTGGTGKARLLLRLLVGMRKQLIRMSDPSRILRASNRLDQRANIRNDRKFLVDVPDVEKPF